VRGWAAGADGAIDVNAPLTDLRLPIATLMGARATTSSVFKGNLPSDAADGTTGSPVQPATVLNRTIEVFDAAGNPRTVAVQLTKQPAGVAGESQWAMTAADGTGATATSTLRFGPDGALLAGGSVPLGPVTLDMSTLTGFAGITSVEAESQNGQEAGTLQSFALNQDGTLMGSFSNGLKQAIGQIALASFANPTGLSKAGSSTYRTSTNSGEPMIGTAGTNGRGALAGGALEMSNVDLSSEFTNLIIAQRGFQANSRVITTSDELLQELVNLKR
jgi:flagellar hook protein FlgE